MNMSDSNANPSRTSRTHSPRASWRTVFLGAVSLILAGALGAAVRTGGTGKFETFGVIEDFGSIVVRGVHYDETAANIIVNDIPNQPRSALKLGMVVGIQSELDYNLGTGTASVVRVNRSMLGQVDSINAANGELRVLAQRIAVDAATRFDGVSGVAQIAPGDWIAVHGLNDPARNLFAATLIERVAPPTDGIAEIRGTVRKNGADRLRIGSLGIVASAGGIDDGAFIAVKGQFDAGNVSLLATEVAVTTEVEVREQVETEIVGFIADFRSRSDFTIAGVAIDASAAQMVGGTVADLKPGVRVTVEGTVRNGVLVATEIEFAVPTRKSTAAQDASIELEGAVTTFTALDNFVVKGRRIDASNASIRANGRNTPAAGIKAHIKGTLLADGSVSASSVEFEKP